jgi:hypothetical protein
MNLRPPPLTGWAVFGVYIFLPYAVSGSYQEPRHNVIV